MKEGKEFEKWKKDYAKIKEQIAEWQIRIPPFVSKLTKEEIYVHGFQSGYDCKLHEMGDKLPTVPLFTFIEDEK